MTQYSQEGQNSAACLINMYEDFVNNVISVTHCVKKILSMMFEWMESFACNSFVLFIYLFSFYPTQNIVPKSTHCDPRHSYWLPVSHGEQ